MKTSKPTNPSNTGRRARHLAIAGLGILTLAGAGLYGRHADAQAESPASAPTLKGAYSPLPGMPPLSDPKNVYGDTGPGRMSAVVKDHLARVYVPNLRSNDVYVIDPETLKVVDKFKVGIGPQHVVPAHDLRTLWVANNAERTNRGSLTPVDPLSGKPGASVPVDDPYNMYFTPDGKSAIVVAEALHRLDFRDPKTMALQYSIETPSCGGINHADFSNDGRFAVFTCEFDGTIAKIDLEGRKVSGYLKLKMPSARYSEKASAGALEAEICTSTKGMPQDIRISPDGSKFYIADMEADGLHVVDGAAFKEIGFIPTGVGTHGIYPSRDGKRLYVANRGTHRIHGKRKGKGSVSVVDFATDKVVVNWTVPGGGSPDMGNVSADGKYLWLSGRFDDVVYRFDTASGDVRQVKVGQEPHGLTVWPQPGRYSLGHTGNLR
ncbi:YncE family protein [Duganella violaceipulchra]|uniref:YVTN family beta-propeller protein n=1 Tax=Duganella violaceipulchra TaxID=2849652 RepID=A0AA41L9H8_9BURK|nr:YncE family protein [Duganella violaceicalia]MBV6323275.1 YncE family protein [Duganella violaceicalia]MCP2007775.1 YVTN family beta-propeller protein [Duganella violaceicalia]